jgi:hypothetical protein
MNLAPQTGAASGPVLRNATSRFIKSLYMFKALI